MLLGKQNAANASSMVLALVLAGTGLGFGGMAHAQKRIEVAGAAAPAAPVIDPAIQRLQTRMDDLEASSRETTGATERAVKELRDAQTQVQRLQSQVDDLSLRIADLEKALADVTALATAANTTAEEAKAAIPPAKGAKAAPKPTPKPAAAAAGAAATPADIGAAKADFTAAMGFLNSGQYDAAEAAFSGFIQLYPKDASVPEARFWLGESYMIRDRYAEAAESYVALIQNNPKASRAPEAMVRLAAALRSLGQTKESCAVVRDLAVRYPNAPVNIVQRGAAEAKKSGCAAG